MPDKKFTGAETRQTFIDFFLERGHTFVPSSSLVPGGDQTLLFTNAGMVQFKDVFLGTDKRPYTRAANSQKCLRVAGKHNDLDEVGRDNTHHTFFEMLGNWSFGDYYKEEAITWAWELLTKVWRIPKDRLWSTYFQDEKGEIPDDDEAANIWRKQPGVDSSHVLPFGRKDNFWEMAETGPCGPCSEIHIDLGLEACDMKEVRGHVCRVNGGCTRFVELWNLVFIQYNRLSPSELEPLPARHVDTGAGLERIVAFLQGTTSNYEADLLSPMMDTIQRLVGHTKAERDANLTPYRVITDHARSATFLIGDGVIPGNIGRNYVCRMIVRRAARFGGKIGLDEPFLAKVAESVIEIYGGFYPEIVENRTTILDNLSREEERFHQTVESGMERLEQLLQRLRDQGEGVLPGEQAFDLYATYGLPLEITRDVAREQGLEVAEAGFKKAMDEHRIASGAGAFGDLEGSEVDIYRLLVQDLQSQSKLGIDGVNYNPYDTLEIEGPVLAIVHAGEPVQKVKPGDKVEVLLPATRFYIEAGGQVSDTGMITGAAQGWEIRVTDIRKPAAGVIVHAGEVMRGEPRVGDWAVAAVDTVRRKDIVRNHTATHLLHAALHEILGRHARQAGSLVAPDHLRFDFTHPVGLTAEELDQIERNVNARILGNFPLRTALKPLQQAKAEGAMALFGEKYAEIVRTVTIGDAEPFSYELCGGTHVEVTNDIGLFMIVTEGSIAAGIRRIEAVTGRQAYEMVEGWRGLLRRLAGTLNANLEQVPAKVESLLAELGQARKEIAGMRQELASTEFDSVLDTAVTVAGVKVLTATLPNADADTLRQMCDRFRQKYPTHGVAVLASIIDERPVLIAAITEDLVKRGLHAGELVKFVATPLGGGGGGKPTLAQAGGKDAAGLQDALESVKMWVEEKLR